ncbi:MAG TPA: IclR family transcriptional regulator [Burkholderiales bacterium]|nr:IclR family transcriptional regulator [Burkholderiales bacterium]
MLKNPYLVPGLERGLRLLQLFRTGRAEIGAPEIARELELPRTTAFRLLQTLEAMEFVERTAGGAFRLGPAVLRLGFEYIASQDITEYGRDVVERLCEQAGASSQLAILDGRELVVVLKKNPAGAIGSNVQVGTRMPAHATVVGRLLLQDADLRKLYPEPRLKQYTAQTPRSVAELERLIAQDRARGYAVSESAYERGISAVAAPVRNHEERVVAALSVIVPQPRLEPKRREALIEQTMSAAAELSRRLSYREAA